MEITVNGQLQRLETVISLQELLDRLAMGRGRFAVELNGEIVPRSSYPEQDLKNGDRLEIVQAIGGG